MGNSIRMGPLIRGLVGAAVGGVVGYFLFGWIFSQGFYAMIVPGAALGIGFGGFSRVRARVNGVVAAVLAVGLGLFTEWKFFPFRKDDSFGYLLSHIHEKPPITLIMIAVGGLCGYWFGIGREPVWRDGRGASAGDEEPRGSG